jgi:hypothetical protein
VSHRAPVQPVNPTATRLIPDESAGYRMAELFLEAQLRQMVRALDAYAVPPISSRITRRSMPSIPSLTM